ncbi:MAG: hypothetical protein JNJ88_10650 [Planctomycetes bacterium]|nr:hypothetical protein [Planctomycetota bacterium]
MNRWAPLCAGFAWAAILACTSHREPAPIPADREPTADALVPSREEQLSVALTRASLRLESAQKSGDPQTISAAHLEFERAEAELERERLRQRRLAELRARTPQREVPMDGGPPAVVAGAGRTAPPSVASAPAGVALAAPASAPASAPATDAEFEALSKRISWLAQLRASTGDHAGATRVRHQLTLLRLDYREGRRDKALKDLRRLEQEADR